MDSIDSILKTSLPDGHIPLEDFELRRWAATRIELAKMQHNDSARFQREKTTK
jgi:hypothetical protein